MLQNKFLFASSKSLSCTRLWQHRFTSTQAETKDEEYHSIIKNTERGKGKCKSCHLLIYKQIVQSLFVVVLRSYNKYICLLYHYVYKFLIRTAFYTCKLYKAYIKHYLRFVRVLNMYCNPYYVEN